MSLTVFLAVIAAAAMHAAWNALVKVRTDRFASISITALGMALVAVPVLPFVDVPHAAVWPWIIASVIIHVGYRLFLIMAYNAGDLAQTYPLAARCGTPDDGGGRHFPRSRNSRPHRNPRDPASLRRHAADVAARGLLASSMAVPSAMRLPPRCSSPATRWSTATARALPARPPAMRHGSSSAMASVPWRSDSTTAERGCWT